MQTIQKQTNNDSIHSAPETTQSRWQNQTAQTANNSMGAVVRRAFIAGVNNSPRLVAQRRYIEGLTGTSQKNQAEKAQSTPPVNQQTVQRSEKLVNEEEKTLQQKFAFAPPVQLKKADPSKPNNAGLSDNLKSGIESLSGMSTDHVKVHYNSSQPAQGLLQRKCACGNHTVVGEECAECAKKKSSLQRKLTIGASNDPLEQEADQVAEQVMASPLNSAINVTPPRIQRFSGQASDAANTAPASVDHVLTGSGRPIEPTLRHDMEQRFGHDFSQVRVHTGGTAEQSARDVNAQAYTAGHNIVFGAGRFAPGSQEGRRLIAHELTHVVQQSRSDGNHAAKRGLKRDPYPIFRATAPTLQRQQAPSAGPVTGVRISSEDGRIVFDTAGGSYSYRLTSCNIPVGDYTVGVTTSGATVHFNFGQAAARSQRFSFGFRIDPGQVNPVTLFENQSQVAVAIVEHLPSPQVAPHSSRSAPLTSRLVAFQRLVKDAGKLRLAENARALEQWRLFLQQQLTPAQVQTQVHAEEARALLESASRRGLAETSLAEQWLQTSGPNRRWVQQQQIEGRYRACTGCHASVQADTMDRRLAEQGPQLRTPIEQLAVGSDQGPRPTFAQGEQITATGQPGLFPVVAQAQGRINILQPYLRMLGPDGYRVLPAETLGSTSPPSELVADIGRRITQRQADYREFSRRIDAADFDYLQLRPIVRDLLPLADADVRQAVLQAIDSAQTWETIESISVGVTSIGLLLLMIFPPTSAIGIGGALALGTAASAHATYRGFQNFEQGRLYSLGRGADSVLDPAQQEAADSLMAIGALNMVLGTVGVASGALGSVRLIRSIPPPGGSLGVVESVEGTAGGNLYRVTGWGTRDPKVVVTGPNGQVIREGMLSSFRPSTPAGARASTTGSSGMAGGYVYPTEGGAARVALPAPLQEPVPAPIPQPVAAPPALANVPVAPNVRAPLATMAGASAADVMASMAAPARQPVMPSGLSRADQELWRTCNQQHNTYKASQEEASAYAARMDPIAVRLHSNRASAQDRLDFCSMLDERIRLVQRLHRERLRYITLDCDRFDWFSAGTTAAERLAQHQIELNNVDAQLHNFYELRTRFCP